MQSKSQIETKVLYDRTELVRIGSKINYTNKTNPRKTTTTSNYSLPGSRERGINR